ncbi:hypothetical protein V8C43DRAFT_122200 [Trichoderma afarasin]
MTIGPCVCWFLVVDVVLLEEVTEPLPRRPITLPASPTAGRERSIVSLLGTLSPPFLYKRSLRPMANSDLGLPPSIFASPNSFHRTHYMQRAAACSKLGSTPRRFSLFLAITNQPSNTEYDLHRQPFFPV